MSDRVQPRMKFGTRPGVLSSSLLDNSRLYKICNMKYAMCKGRVLPGGLGLNQCLLIETLSPDPGLAIWCASRVQVWGFFSFRELELESSRLSLYYFESATNPTEFDLWCSMHCHVVFSKRVPSTSTIICSTNNVKVMHWLSCIFLHGQSAVTRGISVTISIDILLGLG